MHENQALYSIIVYSKSFFFSDWLKSRGLFFITSWRWPNLEEVVQPNCQKINWKPRSPWSRLRCFGGELQNDGTCFTFRAEKMAELLLKIIARMENICKTHDLQNWTSLYILNLSRNRPLRYIFFARHQRGTEILAEMYSKIWIEIMIWLIDWLIDTWTLAFPETREMAWFGGCWSSMLGLKIEQAGIFSAKLLLFLLTRCPDEPQ